MAEFTEIIKEKERMCEYYGLYCVFDEINGKTLKCPIKELEYFTDSDDCSTLIFEHPEEAEKIILKWAKEHPFKTNADKFKEVFGYDIYINTINQCDGLRCPDGNIRCDRCLIKGFWNRRYEGK